MNPQMIEQAQNMMRNMTPEQMAKMQQMMSQMTPEQMANMQRMASTMGVGGATGGTTLSGQASYQLSGARILKEDGNGLHKAGHHADAIKKYDQVLLNLAQHASTEAMDLKMICELNKAMCHLKLEEWGQCEEICSQVLKRGPNLKALYRRGQARLYLQSFRSAAQDLQQAVDMCPPGDSGQFNLIMPKLLEAKKGLAKSSGDGASEPACCNDGSITIEESRPYSCSANPSAAGEQGARASTSSAHNARARLDAMCNMSEEQLRQTATAAGMPEMQGNTAKQMAKMMQGMGPQELDQMMSMAEQLHNGRVAPASVSGGAAESPMDPAIAVDMMSSMSPDQMASMARAAADAGMMPPGMDINPELLKQSAEMMKNMSPEDLRRMQEMATSAQQGGTAFSPGTTGPTAGMGANMLKDPKAIKQAMAMMKQMDEDQLANMMKMNQPNMSDEDARRMAQQMKCADERVMGVLLGGISVLAQAHHKLLAGRDWLRENPTALIAIVVLVTAVILRYVGVM
eukprot:jgi/Ulvmu1/7365/UM036_0025.1